MNMPRRMTRIVSGANGKGQFIRKKEAKMVSFLKTVSSCGPRAAMLSFGIGFGALGIVPANATTITINEGTAESGVLSFLQTAPEFSDLDALVRAGLCSADSPCRTADGGDTVIVERITIGILRISVTWTSEGGDLSPAETGESFTTGASAG